MVKNCDLGLENAAPGLRPRAAFSRPRSRFFTIRTSQPANNIYICATSREVELSVKPIFYRYILEVLAEEAIKFLFMERESCDKNLPMGKALREDKALNTIYFEKIE